MTNPPSPPRGGDDTDGWRRTSGHGKLLVPFRGFQQTRKSMRNDGRPLPSAVVERVESRLLFSVSPSELASSGTATGVVEPVAPPMTVVATASGYVRGGQHASRNFGTSSTLVVKAARHPSYAREAYVSFDIGSLGVAPIGSATLRLFGRRAGTTADGLVTTNLFDAS